MNEFSDTKVLIVEDDPLQLVVEEGLFGAIGVKTVVAESGDAALDILLRPESDIDFVLTDIQMPGMNGMDMTAAFRASSHPKAETLPIVAVTAEEDDSIRDGSIHAGVTALTRKPVTEEILRAYLTLFVTGGRTDAMYAQTLRRSAGEAIVLKEAKEVRDEFRARISHALRTPLNAIEGLVEALDDDTLTLEERRVYRDEIRTSLDELKSRIDSILGHDGRTEVKAARGEKIIPSKVASEMHVLVVDDVAMNRKVIGIHLKRLGVKTVELAENGVDALAILRSRKIDLVLTDICMPVMNGAELGAEVKRDFVLKEIPVAAITAEVNCADSYDLSPFVKVLLKPVKCDDIAKLMDDLGVIRQ